jgi:hypothetical protein
MTVQEFVNNDKDLQTVQDISDVNIIILIYTYVFAQVQNACHNVSRVESLSFHMIT